MQTLKKIWGVISTVVVAAAIVLAAGLVGVRLFGLDVYCVLSGSMEPTYHTGSIIYVKDAEPQDIRVGDPITFVMNEDLVVATHRVVEIHEEDQEFVTKGDANENVDANPVHFNNLIGKPVFTVPKVGYFVNWLQNPPGTYMAISIGAVVLILMFLPDLFAKSEDEPRPKKGRKAKSKGGKDLQPEPTPQRQAPAAPAAQPRRQARPAQQAPTARPAQQRPVRPAPQEAPAPERFGRHGRHAAPAAQQAPRPQAPDRPRGRHAR